MCERYVVHNDCYRSTFYIWPASNCRSNLNMASGLRIHGSLHHAAAREWQEPHIHASSLIYPIFVTSKPKGAQLQAGDVRPATAHTPSHSLTTSKQMLCACNLSSLRVARATPQHLCRAFLNMILQFRRCACQSNRQTGHTNSCSPPFIVWNATLPSSSGIQPSLHFVSTQNGNVWCVWCRLKQQTFILTNVSLFPNPLPPSASHTIPHPRLFLLLLLF